MATGSGWQQQYYCPPGQGKFTSPSAASVPFQSGIAMEYTQDLHLKMSKKIAQLTKVSTVNSGACMSSCLPPLTLTVTEWREANLWLQSRALVPCRPCAFSPFTIRQISDICSLFPTVVMYPQNILQIIKCKVHFVVIGLILGGKYACFYRFFF